MTSKIPVITVTLMFSALAFAQPAVPGSTKGSLAPGQDSSRSGKLFDELAKLDGELFDAAFVTCDQKKFEVFFVDDAEFYHDLAGAKFGPEVKKLGPCPKDKGLSRVVNRGSLQVFKVEGYGAIQTGDHSFIQHGSKTVEVAHFVHLWRHSEKGWQIARILSFGHKQESPKKSF